MQLRAYIDPEKAKISLRKHTKPGFVSKELTVVIKIDDTKDLELVAYMDSAEGVYILSKDITEGSDLTKGFIPEIINTATSFTFTEELDERGRGEKWWCKMGEAQALIESVLHNEGRLKVTIESENLVDVKLLWDAIQKGNIIQYKLHVKTSIRSVIFASQVLEAINELHKEIDLIIKEIERVDRTIQQSNEMITKLKGISLNHENLISNLKLRTSF